MTLFHAAVLGTVLLWASMYKIQLNGIQTFIIGWGNITIFIGGRRMLKAFYNTCHTGLVWFPVSFLLCVNAGNILRSWTKHLTLENTDQQFPFPFSDIIIEKIIDRFVNKMKIIVSCSSNLQQLCMTHLTSKSLKIHYHHKVVNTDSHKSTRSEIMTFSYNTIR